VLYLHINQLLPEMVRQLGLAQTHWGRHVLGLLAGGPVTPKGLAALLFVALPLYLLGSLGMRALAVPGLCKSLVRFTPASEPRLFLALFVTMGPLLTLGCYIVHGNASLHEQYNNSVWFYIQAKYVAWVFAVEMLWALAARLRPTFRLAAVGAVVVLAAPGTGQLLSFFLDTRHFQVEVFGKEEAEVAGYLNAHGSPGQTILPRTEHGLPLPALTPCRVPITSLPLWTDSFAPAPELARRKADRQAFWSDWEQGEVRADILRRYRIDYLVVDRAAGEGTNPASSHADGLLVRPCFENRGFVVYRVSGGPLPRGEAIAHKMGNR
jgi:hypothetical protein